jgi:hypothetical protein
MSGSDGKICCYFISAKTPFLSLVIRDEADDNATFYNLPLLTKIDMNVLRFLKYQGLQERGRPLEGDDSPSQSRQAGSSDKPLPVSFTMPTRHATILHSIRAGDD